jgi:DNA-binding NarL/FixJ family response regulator
VEPTTALGRIDVSASILLVDDHPILRQGLRRLFEAPLELSIVAEASDGFDAVRQVSLHHPDLVIMDISMPNMNGIDATRTINGEFPNTGVVAFSRHEEKQFILRMLSAGASAFVSKKHPFAELLKAVEAVLCHETYLPSDMSGQLIGDYLGQTPNQKTAFSILTDRECEVLQQITEGWSTKEAAWRLHVCERTIETHRKNIMDKLGVHSIAGITKFAIREGITSVETAAGNLNIP